MDEQAISAMADALVERGVLTREQIDAGIAAEHISSDSGETAPTDGSTDPVQSATADPVPDPLAGFEIDPAFAPPEDPNGYRFQAMEPLEVEQVKHVNALFHAAKVPQVIAQQIYADVERLDKESAKLSDAEWKLMDQRCDVELRHAWGGRYDEMCGYFRRLVNDVAKVQPKIIPMLTETPASNSAVLIRQLAEHAERVYSNPRRN